MKKTKSKPSSAKAATPLMLPLWCTALAVFLLDRITKQWIITHSESLPKHFGWISIIYSTNTGITWGFLKAYPFIPLIIATLVVIGIVFYQQKIPKSERVLAGLVLGGAAGNLLDRFIYGAVIDWVDLHWWPVFNVADSAITIAMVWIIYKSFTTSDAQSSARK